MEAVADARPLTAEQQLALEAVYDVFRRTNKWPSFDFISRQLRRGGTDARQVITSIPRELLLYGRPSQPQPGDQLQLTLQGVAQCERGADDVALFLRAVRWLADQELNHESSDEAGAVSPEFKAESIAAGLDLLDSPDQLSRLPRLLELENWGWASIGGSPQWRVTVRPEVWHFRNVQTLGDFFAAQQERHAGPEIPFNYGIVSLGGEYSLFPEASEDSVTATTSSYVRSAVITEIKDKAARSQWDCGKLLRLIEELNSNHAAGQAYAVHALLRMILDHVPPIFGQSGFQGVVNNYAWSKTDKNYMMKLLDFKAHGDDALHRQVSEHPDLLRIDDIPHAIWVSRLLQECAALL